MPRASGQMNRGVRISRFLAQVQIANHFFDLVHPTCHHRRIALRPVHRPQAQNGIVVSIHQCVCQRQPGVPIIALVLWLFRLSKRTKVLVQRKRTDRVGQDQASGLRTQGSQDSVRRFSFERLVILDPLFRELLHGKVRNVRDRSSSSSGSTSQSSLTELAK